MGKQEWKIMGTKYQGQVDWGKVRNRKWYKVELKVLKDSGTDILADIIHIHIVKLLYCQHYQRGGYSSYHKNVSQIKVLILNLYLTMEFLKKYVNLSFRYFITLLTGLLHIWIFSWNLQSISACIISFNLYNILVVIHCVRWPLTPKGRHSCVKRMTNRIGFSSSATWVLEADCH